jgi:site-specific recombinase XerD
MCTRRCSMCGGSSMGYRRCIPCMVQSCGLCDGSKPRILVGRTIHHMVSRAGEAAALPFPVHPHMLRHACGFYLANKNTDTRTIQHYLGHRNIQHTVRYTELAPQRFQDFWDD